MRTLAIALLVASFACAASGAENPCTNGSFEQLAPSGFPVDWGPVGPGVGATDDAHTGKRALRMVRAADTQSAETGLNRGWKPKSGTRGAMIDRLKGGIEFWYKAVSADGARLTVQVIPMDATAFEKTGSSRMMFDVPSDHIGDGQWHRGRMAYDFTSDEKAKWVHFGARIIGKAGELLLDDVSYIEKVGPLLAIRALHIVENETQPGRKCLVKVSVKNAGDEPARNVQVALTVPAGLKAVPPSAAVGNLAPQADAWTRMTLDGPRDAAGALKAVATSGTLSAQATRKLEPKLSIVSFGPKHPVADVGTPAVLQCVLKNDGNANVRDVRAVFTQPGGQRTVGAKAVAPGRSVILECPVPTAKPLAGAPVSVAVRAGNVDGVLGADSRLVVAPPAFAPPPQPKGVAVGQVAAADGFAFIGNEHLCLTFRRGEAGFGPAWLFVRREGKWARAACLPRLSRIVARATPKGRWEPAIAVTERPATRRDNRTLHLACRWQQKDAEGGEWTLSAAFALKEGEKSIGVDYQLACTQPRELLAFDGPMLYALHRDEAVFPGLEWLVDDEVSSSTLDIEEGHPHQKRFVVHPNLVTIPAIGVRGENGTVGLLWDVHQKWDGTRDRPSALFASPDRLHNQRAHLMGLFLPTVPDFVEANTTEAAQPYPLEAGQTLRLRCRLFADGGAADPLAAMDEWIRLHGWAEPTPLPHGSYEREIEFSMQGYLKSLWEAESQEWWSSKGGSPKMCKLGRHRAYVADCLLGVLLSPDEAVREQCRARADEVLKLIGGEPRLDAHRFPGRADHSYARTGLAAVLLNSVGDDGGWRFNAERRGTSVFEGIDYHVLGPHDALELGTCARNAFEVLRYARIAGEPRAYAGMRKSLELMESFRVPRAAQVWEVPVHAPDILAAADAVSAYTEAYRFSGDARWLKDAVTWARRGLPFVYLWGLPEKPYLLGGSIAVFGATFYRGSWFGRPVQWNGLRYANAVLKLAEHDRSYPWRRIAELIIHSAIHQQDLEGENVALWPDNIDAVTDQKCPWVFAPRQILRNILKLTGRDEDPATVIVGAAPNRVHITATATITDATWQGGRLAFRAAYPAGEQGVVLVSNVARPAAVLLDGKPIAERRDVETGVEPGWRYDDADGFLSIRIASDGATAVQVDGARFRNITRLPEVVETIDFTFDKGAEGWVAAHDVRDLHADGGLLVGTVTAPDPYVIRYGMRVKAADVAALIVRMRVTAGQGAQLFFTTEASGGYSEDKSLRFAVVPDGTLRDYRLPVGKHAAWKGTITALRLDPTGGVADAEFAFDSVKGVAR